VKALRLFVESVLRYGLPVNFQGMFATDEANAETPEGGPQSAVPAFGRISGRWKCGY